MMPRLTALAAALLLAGSVHAADKIKVGLVSTLSGPGAGLGVDIRDGFQLGIKHLGGKLGIDVAAWWRPTAKNYFKRLTKTAILNLFAEIGGCKETQ